MYGVCEWMVEGVEKDVLEQVSSEEEVLESRSVELSTGGMCWVSGQFP